MKKSARAEFFRPMKQMNRGREERAARKKTSNCEENWSFCVECVVIFG